MKVEASEMQEITSALRNAVSVSGLTQSQFARAIGTSAARMSAYLKGRTTPSAALYLRALRFGDARAAALRHRLTDPTDIASRVNKALRDDDSDETWAFRLMLRTRADLATALTRAPEAAQAWARRAAAIDDKRFDVLLQALIAHEHSKAGIPAPEWTREGKLDAEWIPDDPFRGDDTIRAQTPDWLAERGILIAESGLATA